jgi:hypothetical protein
MTAYASRETRLWTEADHKAKFRELGREAFLVKNYELSRQIAAVLATAELNACQTDFAQDHHAVDEYFWQTVIGSISDSLSDTGQPLAVRNWFALNGIKF